MIYRLLKNHFATPFFQSKFYEEYKIKKGITTCVSNNSIQEVDDTNSEEQESSNINSNNLKEISDNSGSGCNCIIS